MFFLLLEVLLLVVLEVLEVLEPAVFCLLLVRVYPVSLPFRLFSAFSRLFSLLLKPVRVNAEERLPSLEAEALILVLVRGLEAEVFMTFLLSVSISSVQMSSSMFIYYTNKKSYFFLTKKIPIIFFLLHFYM
jgi:hypothetical protein